jgi:hypothetical protein
MVAAVGTPTIGVNVTCGKACLDGVVDILARAVEGGGRAKKDEQGLRHVGGLLLPGLPKGGGVKISNNY